MSVDTPLGPTVAPRPLLYATSVAETASSLAKKAASAYQGLLVYQTPSTAMVSFLLLDRRVNDGPLRLMAASQPSHVAIECRLLTNNTALKTGDVAWTSKRPFARQTANSPTYPSVALVTLGKAKDAAALLYLFTNKSSLT